MMTMTVMSMKFSKSLTVKSGQTWYSWCFREGVIYFVYALFVRSIELTCILDLHLISYPMSAMNIRYMYTPQRRKRHLILKKAVYNQRQRLQRLHTKNDCNHSHDQHHYFHLPVTQSRDYPSMPHIFVFFISGRFLGCRGGP